MIGHSDICFYRGAYNGEDVLIVVGSTWDSSDWHLIAQQLIPTMDSKDSVAIHQELSELRYLRYVVLLVLAGS